MVTAAQAAAAQPIYQALLQVSAALAQLTAASGNSSITEFSVGIGDANGNPISKLVLDVPLPPAQAAPFYQAMIAQMTALQTTLQTELGAI